MNWKLIGKFWLLGIFVFVIGSMLIGCGSRNWSPTDPRVDSPDYTSPQVLDTWQVDVGAKVQ